MSNQRLITRRDAISAVGATMLASTVLTTEGVATAATSISQSVLVKNATTGAVIVGAKVAVYDNVACYAPKATDNQGKAAFVTNGIRTIQALANGYSSNCVTVNQSATAYTVSLSPKPNPATHKFVANTSAVIQSSLDLLRKYGVVTYLGTLTLGQIETKLGGLGVVGLVACEAFPFAAATPVPDGCKLAMIALGTASAGTWLAQNVFGVPTTTKFKFYFLNVPGLMPTLLIMP